MSNFRDFDAMLAEKLGGRPTFILAGEKFTCRAKLPWKKFSTMLMSMSTGVIPEGQTSIDQTEEFFRFVLIPRDRDRFILLLNADVSDEDDDEEESEGKVADNTQVGELLNWLLDYYTGKALENDEKSSPELPSTGQPLKSASLNPVA